MLRHRRRSSSILAIEVFCLVSTKIACSGGPRKRLMARKLKTYQTSLGFFDLAMAAPSMIAAAMAKPGVVLRLRTRCFDIS